MNNHSRRSFIQSSAAAGAALALPSHRLFAQGANEDVRIGIIGCGWRGGELAKYFQRCKNARVAGLCDVDSELVDKLGQEFPQAKKWTDLRHMLDSLEIDAVAIATCNHWHCLAAIWAMQAAKDVYVEKPLGHNQFEGDQVVRCAESHSRICQVGTQQRSDPMQLEIKNFLHEEKALGEIQSVRVNRLGVREPIGRRSEPLTPPKSVDYNLWLGPAADQPIYRNKLHYDWHWDWNTGSGEMGNWGVHIIDDVRNNVFLDKVAAPRAVTAAGGRFAWNDAGNTPNLHFAVLDTGSIPVAVTLSNLKYDKSQIKAPGPGSGYIVYCENGRLEGQRGKAVAFDGEGNKIKEFSGEGGNIRHQQNFIDAIRNSDPTILLAPAETGNDSTGWCNMINVAARVPRKEPAMLESLASSFGPESTSSIVMQLNAMIPDSAAGDKLQLGPTLHFDTKGKEFSGTHASVANGLMRRQYRKAFEVHEV